MPLPFRTVNAGEVPRFPAELLGPVDMKMKIDIEDLSG